MLQVPWGRLSDRVGRRVPFIVFGTVLASSLFLLMAASTSPWQLILVVLVQALVLSMVGPTWGALLGEKTGFGARGRVFGSLSRVAGIAGLGGTVLAAFLVFGFPETEAGAFHIPLILAALIGIASGLVVLSIRESRAEGPVPAAPASPADAERRADFLYFVKTQALYNFFMSLVWPLVPVTVAIVLGATNLDIVMITVVTAVSTIVLQSQVGRLLDRVGPTALIQVSRFLFILVPLAYGFANNLLVIYIVAVAMGVPTAIVNIAFNAYILDVAPPRKHAEYFGVFNTAIGVVTFAGSLLGGYLARLFEGAWGSLWLGLLAVYVISFAGRSVGAVLTLRLRDPTKYPESMDDVWRRFEATIENGRNRAAARLPGLRNGPKNRRGKPPA